MSDISPTKADRAPNKYRSAAVALAAFIVLCVVILVSGNPSQSSVSLVKALIWPAFAVLAVLFFRDQAEALLATFNAKMENATNIAVGSLKIEIGPDRIPVPQGNASVTLENVALLHTSFLRPDKTQQYNDGMTYYQIEIVVIAPAATLNRIEKVTYRLHPSYRKNVYEIVDRGSRFKLQELAYGSSIVRAEIQLKDKDQPPICLNRFIDLRPEGPRI